MDSATIENLVLQYGPFVLVALVTAIVILMIMRPKKEYMPIECPLPAKVLLDEIESLLIKAFETLPEDAFLGEAKKLYHAKTLMTPQFTQKK